MRGRRKASGGFTLIELMVAMALSTVGLLGLVALQTIAIRGNMMSRNFGEAIAIAQQRVEAAERTPYASVSAMLPSEVCPTSSSYCDGGTAGLSPDPNLSSTQAIYTRCTTFTDNGDSTTTILVRTCWLDQSNNWHKVQLLARRSP